MAFNIDTKANKIAAHHSTDKLIIACDTNDFQMCHKILTSNPKLINTRYPKIANWLHKSPFNPGSTAIHYAARSGHYNMVHELIKTYGANVNAKDNQNWNALHYSCHSGHYSITKLLLNNSVNHKIITKYEKCTPPQFAQYKKWNDIIQLFNDVNSMRNTKENDYMYTLKEKHEIIHKTKTRLNKLIIQSNSISDAKLCRYYKPFDSFSCRNGAQCPYKHLNFDINKYNKYKGGSIKLDLYMHRYEINWEIHNKLKQNLCKTDSNTLIFKCIDTQLKQLYNNNENGRVWFMIYHSRSMMNKHRNIFERMDGMRVIRSGSISRLDHILVVKVDNDDDLNIIKILTNILKDKMDIIGNINIVEETGSAFNDNEFKSNDNMHMECVDIKWDKGLSIPNIDTIMNNLNHKQLFVGFGANNHNGTALVNYALYDTINPDYKVSLIKQCIDNNIALNRAIGCMYGMGIGDAVGAPLEFLDCVRFHNKSYFKLQSKEWINEYNKFGVKRGQWTDDASMGLCIADSLIKWKQFDGSDIRIRFWNWWNNGLCNAFRYDTKRSDKCSIGLGNNISKSLYCMKDNQTPSAAFQSNKNKDDSGNGSLMRLAPIPIFYSCADMNVALQYAKYSSFTTHQGHIAAEACALTSFVIINAINRKGHNKEGIQSFLERITDEYLCRINMEYGALLKRRKEKGNNKRLQRVLFAKECIIKLLKGNEGRESKERCWNWRSKYGNLGIDLTMSNRGSKYNGYPNSQGYFGSYCMDGIAMALHSAYHSTSFGSAIQNAVNLLGDADSTGSIAGQIAGAFYGFGDVFYDKNGEGYLLKQITKWDKYDFGLRAVLLYCIGCVEFSKKV